MVINVIFLRRGILKRKKKLTTKVPEVSLDCTLSR